MWLWTESFLQARTQQVKGPWRSVITADLSSRSTTRICHIPFVVQYFHRRLRRIYTSWMKRVRMCKYADDCTVYASVPSSCLSNTQKVLDCLQSWATSKLIICFWTPRKLRICRNSIEPKILWINNTHQERVSQFKLLGVRQQNNLCWNYHFK